jgi:aryl-alcohol dehydrogenase-like predicted oxidoreductase
VHRPSATTDVEVRWPISCARGKVRYIGSSSCPASQIVEAQ